MHQPVNAPNRKIMTIIDLLHVSALGCHLQGAFRSKKYKPQTLIKVSHRPHWNASFQRGRSDLRDCLRMAPRDVTFRRLIFIINCILLSTYLGWYISTCGKFTGTASVCAVCGILAPSVVSFISCWAMHSHVLYTPADAGKTCSAALRFFKLGVIILPSEYFPTNLVIAPSDC